MIVFLIIILAAILRLANLSNLPPGLYLDEVLYGLDAYSLIHTGKDIYGHFLPLAFQSSGYYPPLFIYILAPLFLFLPLEAWVVRLPAALAGITTIAVLYYFTRQLVSKKHSSTPLLAAALLAFSPYHLHFSRVAFLASFGIIFPLLATYLFLKQRILLSAIIFGLSTHVHYGYKLFSPLLFGMLIILYRTRLKFHRLIIPLILIGFITLFSNWYAVSRYNALSRVDQLSGTSPNQIITGYLKVFSPQFLFFKSGDYLLTNPWGKGLLLTSLLPAFIIGAFKLRRLSFNSLIILILWLFIPPIPSALAGAATHLLRLSPILIPLTIISALGLETLFARSRLVGLGLVFLISLETLSAFKFYTQIYPQASSDLWGQPQRQLVHEAITKPKPVLADNFNTLLAFYAFEAKTPPQLLQRAILQPITLNGLPAKKVDHVYFIPAEEL